MFHEDFVFNYDDYDDNDDNNFNDNQFSDKIVSHIPNSH